jgi:hypothetical protein
MPSIEYEGEIGNASDGFHTFNELYEHRIALFLALCRHLDRIDKFLNEWIVWRSALHFDGSSYEGWFIMGISTKPGKQISYHLPMSKWNDAGFAITLDHAPEWDGHTPNDVIERLNNL